MTTKSKLSGYWLNILLLALAIFFANLWLKYHLSEKSSLIVFANGLIAVYGITYSLLGKTIGEKGQNEIVSHIQRFFWILLKPGFLVTIYLILIIAGSMYASVSLVNNLPQQPVELKLFPIESQKSDFKSVSFSNSNVIIKKGFFTSPFGRVMTIRAKGYRDYTFELFPFAGKKIMLKDALIPLPSIWIRSYPTIVNMLLNNSQLGKISKEQRAGNWEVWQTSLSNPSFAEYATLCGARGVRVTEKSAIEGALAEALAHEGPSLVELVTDGELI